MNALTANGEKPANLPPDDLVDEFSRRLVEVRTVTVKRDILIGLWSEVDRGWAGRMEARRRLAFALQVLETDGTVELPSRRGQLWDASAIPLPDRVVVPASRQDVSKALDPADEPWVPALGWAADWIVAARPPQRLRIAAVEINRWLLATTGRDVPRVAREERSLDIFGDEKRLGRLASGALFSAGRMTLELLACDLPVGGLRIATFARAGRVLVVENKSTFDSAWRALRTCERPGYAAVVFGSGDAVESLVHDLLVLDELVEVSPSGFHYAGDVDIAGVEAAAAFAGAASTVGLEVTMASALWKAVAAADPVGEDLTGDERQRAEAIATAAALRLPDSVIACLEAGVRVPQERVDRTAFADTSWWVPSP